jgi:hypothetical protein
MFILEKYEDWNEINVGKTYYSNVTFKNGFLETLQRTLEEQNKKLVLFGKEMNSTEVVEFLKKAQSQQLSPNSRCHVFDCVSDNGYFEIIVIPEDDEDTFQVNLNLTDITKPIFYVSTKTTICVRI